MYYQALNKKGKFQGFILGKNRQQLQQKIKEYRKKGYNCYGQVFKAAKPNEKKFIGWMNFDKEKPVYNE